MTIFGEGESSVARAEISTFLVVASVLTTTVFNSALVDVPAGRSVHRFNYAIVTAEADDANLAVEAAPEGL